MHADYEPPFVHGDQSGDRSAQVIQIDSGKHVAAVAVCAALCGMCAIFAWHSDQKADEAITEYHVMFNHQMYLENQVENLKEKLNALRPER